MGLKSNPRLGLLSPIHTLWLHPHPWDQVHFNCRFSMHCGIIYIQSIVLWEFISGSACWTTWIKLRIPIHSSQVPNPRRLLMKSGRETVFTHSWSSSCQLEIFTPFPEPVWKKHVKRGLCSKFLCNLSTFTEFWVESRQEYNDTSQEFRGTFKFTLRIHHNVTCKKFCENPFDNIIQFVSYK